MHNLHLNFQSETSHQILASGMKNEARINSEVGYEIHRERHESVYECAFELVSFDANRASDL